MMASRTVPILGRRALPMIRKAAKACSARYYCKTSAIGSDGELGDRCDLHIVRSPYPDIQPGPYPPIAEFVTADWAPDGHLGHQTAILDYTTGLSRTFADYREITGNLAGALKEDFDLHEDSTVTLFTSNHVDYLPICLSVSLCGAKLVPINPMYTENEMEVILQRSRSSIVITHLRNIEVALKAAKNTKTVKHVIVITDDDAEPVPEGTISLASLKKSHSKPFFKTIHQIHSKTASHPYLLPYSSGTTGFPKGVCLSHENIVANLLQFEEVEALGFPPDHKLVSPLPFFHIYGFLVSMMYPAWKGQKVITTSGRFDLAEFCQLVQDEKPQRAHLVPPIMVGLSKHPMVDNYDLTSMQMIITAAAPLSEALELDVVKRIGCDVKQAWGMSELSPIGTLNSDGNFKTGSVGPLVSNTYAKIVDPEGNSLGPNQDGELVVKGPQVMMGYLDDPEKTQECLSKSRWLRTGDVAHYDEDGYFYITDRVKELIKVRGFQVAPAELEALLLTNEHVSDAAVIQIPDEESGELPCAYVVLKDEKASCQVTDEDIKEWVKERVAPYKRLEGGVVFCDAIPKSASGKILRRILRDQVKANTESSSQ